MGPGATLSFCASLMPTCSTTSSMVMPANVPRELFTCCSRDVSWALSHCGNFIFSFSRTLSSLPAGAEEAEGAPTAAVVGGGGEGTTGWRG